MQGRLRDRLHVEANQPPALPPGEGPLAPAAGPAGAGAAPDGEAANLAIIPAGAGGGSLRALTALQMFRNAWLREHKLLGRTLNPCTRDAWTEVRRAFEVVPAEEKGVWHELARQSTMTARLARRVKQEQGHALQLPALPPRAVPLASADGPGDPDGHNDLGLPSVHIEPLNVGQGDQALSLGRPIEATTVAAMPQVPIQPSALRSFISGGQGSDGTRMSVTTAGDTTRHPGRGHTEV